MSNPFVSFSLVIVHRYNTPEESESNLNANMQKIETLDEHCRFVFRYVISNQKMQPITFLSLSSLEQTFVLISFTFNGFSIDDGQ